MKEKKGLYPDKSVYTQQIGPGLCFGALALMLRFFFEVQGLSLLGVASRSCFSVPPSRPPAPAGVVPSTGAIDRCPRAPEARRTAQMGPGAGASTRREEGGGRREGGREEPRTPCQRPSEWGLMSGRMAWAGH